MSTIELRLGTSLLAAEVFEGTYLSHLHFAYLPVTVIGNSSDDPTVYRGILNRAMRPVCELSRGRSMVVSVVSQLDPPP